MFFGDNILTTLNQDTEMLENKIKIDFKPITAEDKALYEDLLSLSEPRGCEYSFANMFLWGEQKIAFINGCACMQAKFGEYRFYYHPIGNGDIKKTISEIMEDADARSIPFSIKGMTESETENFKSEFGDEFEITTKIGSYDYVYSIDDLADLAGKKYHGKRNHIHRFCDEHDGYRALPIDENILPKVREMAEEWYEEKLSSSPDDDFKFEKAALMKAFDFYKEIGLVGMAIIHEDKVLAFTIASRIYPDTFDVHFEKARADVAGAYTVINRDFARYIRDTHPEVKYLDREEDMGIPGLRKAKESYHPHHRVIKYNVQRRKSV